MVNHIGLTVSDLDRSVSFYQDVVGMEIARRGFRTGGEWFDILTENHGAVVDAVMMSGDDVVLQLVQYYEGGNPDSVTGHNRVGNMHLSINVDDLDAKYSQIAGVGVRSCTPIVDLPIPGMRSFYVRDPDGVPVEFIASPTLAVQLE